LLDEWTLANPLLLELTATQIRKICRKIRFRRAIHRWRFLLILLALLFLGGAGYAGYWGYGKLLNRQAYALISRAMEDLKEGKPTEARMGVETALLLGKPSPLDFLRKHSSENPGNLSSVATLAFAELKAGNTQAAMRLFDAAPRALRAGALGANPPFQKSASKSSACLGARIFTPTFRKQAAGK
jgi:hypothetical protein